MAEEFAEAPDTADKAVERNQRKEAARQRRADADVMRGVLRTKDGRDWLFRRLQRGHLYVAGPDGIPFVAGQPDHTGFRLGEMNFAVMLDNEARDASLDLFTQMFREQKDEEKRLDAVRREEREKREAETKPLAASEAMAMELPPPAGYPGGPPLPKKPEGKT